MTLVGAMLILLSAYQLFFSRSGSYEGLTLGRVSALEKVVKVKRARAIDWVDAFPDDLVTENQMIYTDEMSRAEVNFTGGQKLVINENSLVKIRARGNENELDVGKGTIRAQLTGDESLVVKLNGEDYELKGKDANIEINLHGNVGEIGVVSGKVELEKDGKTTALDEKTAIVVEGDNYTTKVIAYNLNAPAKQSVLYTGADFSEVQFSWTGEEVGSIRISTRQDLSDAVAEPINGNSFRKSLGTGQYFWKIEGEKGDSLVSEFRLVKEIAPEILRPKSGDEIDVLVDENGSRNVRLEWTSATATKFAVEVDGKISEVSQETFSAAANGNELSWRVKVNDPARTEAVWSELQKIKIKAHPFPQLPRNLHPDGVEYQSFSKTPEPVELSWSSAHESEIEVKSPSKTETYRKTENSFTLSPETGLHRWRIRSVDNFGRASGWSEWKEFTIVDMSGEKNAEGIQRIQLNRPDQEVTFGWEENNGNNVFELSQDKNFDKVIVKKDVKGAQTKLTVPKTGTYYWRSREFRKDGTLHVSEPKKVIIEPVPAPGKPQTLPPMEVPLEHSETTTSIFDFIFSPAYADDVTGVARIHLPLQENAKHYVLKIFRKGEEAPLFEERLDKPDFVWRNALPGEYDFQYAIVDFFERQSPFSDRSSLIVKEAGGPARALLISPIRMDKVASPEIEFKWGHAERAKEYRLTIYRDEALKEKVKEEEIKKTEFSLEEKLPDGTYYWQVLAVDERGETTPSSVGRFVYEPPKEESIPVPGEWEKAWKSRGHVAWAPSSDTYKFSDGGDSGKIDGNVLMGIEGRGTLFRPKWIYTGEFIRQSGQVFKKEEYLFMKLSFDAGWILKTGKHMFSAGPSLGFASGQTYGIDNSTITASGVSGAIYGGVVRSFHALSPLWNAEGKLSYLLGAITEMELSGNFMRDMNGYYLLIGAGYVGRSYDKNEGEQTSLKLNAGIGREF
jgi:hypothetical protein